MHAATRLRRARAVLLLGALVSAVGWGMGCGVALLLLLALLDLGLGLPLLSRQLALMASAGLAGGVVLAILWRNRDVLSLDGVALWLEDRVPALRYALVTLRERRFASSGPTLEAVVATTSWGEALRRALTRASYPLLFAAVSVALFRALPPAVRSRLTAPHRGDVLDHAGPGGAVHPLHPLVVTVTPPAYSGLPPSVLEDPQTVQALAGSGLRVEGASTGTGVSVQLGKRALSVTGAPDRWRVTLTMPETAAPLWLSAGARRQLLVLEPRIDSVPVVELLAPVRDTVRRAINGAIALRATATDDFGLREGWFEYIVSAGSGENFTFRSGVIGRHEFASVRSDGLRGLLQLDSLHLAPGNVVYVRAVVRDRNTVTGPGLGASETRTIRIPRLDEGDSVQVDPAAPAQGDSAVLSQRMLIMLTEALERSRPRLRRDTVIAESRAIARDQSSLRRRVADVLFLRLGGEVSAEEAGDTASPAGLAPEALLRAAEQATVINGGEALDFSEDETPVVALNRPLLEAYNAMWEAGRALEIGEPGRALPPMRLALAAIQRARQAERLYLRGRPAPITVDLARVRLTGTRADVMPDAATGRPLDEGSPEALLARFTRALGLLPDPAATDSLLLLRIAALESAPTFAGALGEPLAALRAGRDATQSLLHARRLLLPASVTASGLAPWDLLP